MTPAMDKILELQSTSSSLTKQRIMRENADDSEFKILLRLALDPHTTFKASEKTLREACNSASGQSVYANVIALCSAFAQKKALSDADIANAGAFLCNLDANEREFCIKLLAKTLRLGVTGKSVNKVFPGLIPEWEVQQAYPMEKYPIKEGTWFAATQKLNGVRATYYRGSLYGRSGEVFEGLEHIIIDIPESLRYTTVFDGELTLRAQNGMTENEAFRIVTGLVNSENVDKSAVWFTVFDALPVNEFDAGESTATYRQRRESLDFLFAYAPFGSSVNLLPVLYEGTDQKQIEPLLNKMVAEDKEGLMLNLDVPYRCKRHRGILKVKRFYTMDLPIIRCEQGSGRLADTLGAVVVDFAGTEVGVGSGFTDEQRAWFWQNREDVVGSLVEVKYKEISADKTTGNRSLQFPVFVSLRTDKNEVSFG